MSIQFGPGGKPRGASVSRRMTHIAVGQTTTVEVEVVASPPSTYALQDFKPYDFLFCVASYPLTFVHRHPYGRLDSPIDIEKVAPFNDSSPRSERTLEEGRPLSS